MSLKEKAAGVLDTPATASNNQCAASVPASENAAARTLKDFRTLQAMLSRHGNVLQRVWRADCAGGSFLVINRGGAYIPFPDIEGVQNYPTQLDGAHE
jgi:hypothetical protein